MILCDVGSSQNMNESGWHHRNLNRLRQNDGNSILLSIMNITEATKNQNANLILRAFSSSLRLRHFTKMSDFLSSSPQLSYIELVPSRWLEVLATPTLMLDIRSSDWWRRSLVLWRWLFMLFIYLMAKLGSAWEKRLFLLCYKFGYILLQHVYSLNRNIGCSTTSQMLFDRAHCRVKISLLDSAQIGNQGLDIIEFPKMVINLCGQCRLQSKLDGLINVHFLPPPPTLKRKKMISPSSTTQSLPFCTYLPSALTACSFPSCIKSSQRMISAQMKPFSKSVWMVPAAWGALVSLRMVQQRTSSVPEVKKQIRSSALQPALMILGSMVRLLGSLFWSSSRSCSALQGMISPGPLASMQSLIFFSHLFFFVTKSSALRLTRYTTDLAVMKRWVLMRPISSFRHSPCLTHLFFCSSSSTFTSTSFSSLASLGLVRLMTFSRSQSRLVTYSRSLRTSSLLMMSMSLKGSTEFQVWVISSSSKALTTWQMPSTSRMLLRK